MYVYVCVLMCTNNSNNEIQNDELVVWEELEESRSYVETVAMYEILDLKNATF